MKIKTEPIPDKYECDICQTKGIKSNSGTWFRVVFEVYDDDRIFSSSDCDRYRVKEVKDCCSWQCVRRSLPVPRVGKNCKIVLMDADIATVQT